MLLAGASFVLLHTAPAAAQQSDKSNFMKAAVADINARDSSYDKLAAN